MKRDYHDPQYKLWRKLVFTRDDYRCKMPGCLKKRSCLHAHHIKRWADYPTLRFVVSNGITLCKACHKKIFNHEDIWAPVFLRLITNPHLEADIHNIKRGRK